MKLNKKILAISAIAGVFFSGYYLVTFVSSKCLINKIQKLDLGQNEFVIQDRDIALENQLLPWAAIGGCGAGGSGGGGGDGIKWVGFGVSGGLVDFEMMSKLNFGQNFQNISFSPRFSYKPTYTTTMGISIPVTSKTGSVQYQTNQPENVRVTGGIGDISVDISKSLGMSGEYSLGLAVTLPTGQYDIKRGSDNEMRYLPSSLQKGGGLYSASLSLGRIIDVEDGMWMIDFSYSNPFMLSFSGENRKLSDFPGYVDRKDNSRFYYTFKPYGENDLGAFSPTSLSGGIVFGYKGFPNYVYSYGITFSAPLDVAWIQSEKVGTYDPKPDPDHKAWSGAFVYGIEFTKHEYPLFLAFSLPIHDRANPPSESDKYDPTPMKKWDWPDWKDFGNQWTIALGIKSTMF